MGSDDLFKKEERIERRDSMHTKSLKLILF